MTSKKIIVIGGGTAGLMASGSASEEGAEVLLLEKMDMPGRKLQITGKGRCNLTNTAELPEFLKKFSDRGRFLKPAFCRFFNTELIEFFRQIGVPAKVERGGRVFPESDSAKEVVAALLNWLRKQGVRIMTGTAARKLVIQDDSVIGVEDYSGIVHKADAVILATGGASYAGTGSSGDGYKIAKQAGHRITEIRPALVPIETTGNIAAGLQGLSLKNVAVSAYIQGKKEGVEFGEMLFTHYGLSGPAILTLSRLLTVSLNADKETEISIDLKPALEHKKLDLRLLREMNAHGKQQLKTILKNLLPKKMVIVCLSLTGISGEKLGNQVTAAERKRLRVWLKDFRLQVSGYRPLEEAIITAGGIPTIEINSRDMSSKIIKNLFFAGEIIDVDAKTGGYNLQAAFSSGWVAGHTAGKKCK